MMNNETNSYIYTPKQIEDVVNRFGKKVDMIDVTEVVPGSDFENEVNRTGVTIYE